MKKYNKSYQIVIKETKDSFNGNPAYTENFISKLVLGQLKKIADDLQAIGIDCKVKEL